MAKVRIIALSSQKNEVVDFIHRMGLVDIRKSDLPLKDDSSGAAEQEINELLLRVSGALKILPKGAVRSQRHIPLSTLSRKVGDLAAIDAIYSLNEERAALLEEKREAKAALKILEYFEGTGIDFSSLKSDHLLFRAFLASTADALKVQKLLGSSRAGNECILNQLPNGRSLVFVAYAKDLRINDITVGIPLSELDLRSHYLDNTVTSSKARIIDKLAKLKGRLEEISSELSSLSSAHYSDLVNYQEMLEIEHERSAVQSLFKRTNDTFIIYGWVPESALEGFGQKLESFTNHLSYLEVIETEELPPTLVRRPAFLKPFDYLVEFFSLPRSDEIDPTWIFIISFPIFYGLMISDVGYGLSSLLFSLFLIRISDRESLIYNVAKVWQISSISAIVFGFLSNEYFGFQLNHYFTTFSGFDWTTHVNSIILLTLVFGISQVSLGLLFGFINNYNKRHFKMAASKLTSVALILSGVVAVGGMLFHAFSPSLTAAASAAAVIFLIATVALSGSEAAELTNLMTHPLSYTRLLGFGFASIIISKLIDMAFTPQLGHGIVAFAAVSVIFIVLQFLNMVLGIFEGLVQGVRLNFIEFFSKFYTGNGVKFRPFSYRRKYSAD